MTKNIFLITIVSLISCQKQKCDLMVTCWHKINDSFLNCPDSSGKNHFTNIESRIDSAIVPICDTLEFKDNAERYNDGMKIQPWYNPKVHDDFYTQHPNTCGCY